MGPEEIEGELEELTEALNPDNLRGLELLRMDPVSPKMQFSDRFRESARTSGKTFGYDDRTEFYVLYRLGDKHFMGTTTLCRFGDDWVINALGSALANVVAGMAPQVTVEEYEKFLAEEGAPK